ncbi:hypothetical protein C400_14435 [Paenibacillus sp. ICGEB2008]|nr:hypothetical protein C400_14435 [Paenibacillus sp. ICGEB2008]
MVEVFSIDEQFLDMSGSLSLFGDPLSIASEIQRKVLGQTGVWIEPKEKYKTQLKYQIAL